MSTSTTQNAVTSSRIHGLDAIRAGALLLGIVLHALMPFVPGMPWMISDQAPVAYALPANAVIHLFRMSVFMLLAGYFARVVVAKRGPARFLRERFVRIAVPVLAFWPLAVLPLGLISMWWHQKHGIPLPPPPADPAAAFTPGQLWFLWVLMQVCLIVIAARALALRLTPTWSRRLADGLSATTAGPVGFGLLAVTYLITLFWQATNYSGIDAPTTLLPEASGLVAYGTAFVVGWLLARRPDSLQRLGRRWRAYLVMAAITSAGVLLLGGLVGLPAGPNWALAVCSAASSAAWCFGLIGMGATHLREERAWIRYLADASYWMYLLHLPLLVGIGAFLTHAPLLAEVKLLITMGLTTIILIVSYDLFVRSTWIGKWLNGRRHSRALFRARGRDGFRP